MTPEERREIYPKFIVEEIEKEEPEGFSPKKVTDFIQFVRVIWVLSSQKYQERFWVRQQLPMRGDSYMETLEEFLSTGRTILGDREKPIEMTLKQREMLLNLYGMITNFEEDDDTPEDPGHGLNDAEIIKHPKWHQIQDYAKLVYEELSGDDLDVWEKSKPK